MIANEACVFGGARLLENTVIAYAIGFGGLYLTFGCRPKQLALQTAHLKNPRDRYSC